jgi:hypothetical protein
MGLFEDLMGIAARLPWSVSVALAVVLSRCGSRMVSRVARQGRNAGQSFWGCDTVPAVAQCCQ